VCLSCNNGGIEQIVAAFDPIGYQCADNNTMRFWFFVCLTDRLGMADSKTPAQTDARIGIVTQYALLRRKTAGNEEKLAAFFVPDKGYVHDWMGFKHTGSAELMAYFKKDADAELKEDGVPTLRPDGTVEFNFVRVTFFKNISVTAVFTFDAGNKLFENVSLSVKMFG
jgi:hypothetical protein